MESSGSGVVKAVVEPLNRPVGAPFCLSGVWRLLSAPWILWPWGGFITVSETYGIHNWHDRVSFCLPCVILTLRLYGKKKRLLSYEIERFTERFSIRQLKVIIIC